MSELFLNISNWLEAHDWYTFDTWIVIIGALCAMSCALLGNFLVLRQMSMMGDAISHAVLPGLAIAFWITGSRSSWEMFLGAVIVGILTALFTQWVQNFGKVDRGASMGIVFTTFFAIGLILIVKGADNVDLDAQCVLYGAIEFTPLDKITLFGYELPRAFVILAAVFLVNLILITVFYKEFKISSFDPSLATTLGINANVMHYLLMTLVAVTTVASFEAIGSILVIAMLIVPAAAAHLLTDRLSRMIFFSLIIGALSAFFGHWSAITVPGWISPDFAGGTQTASMMAVAAGFIFLVILLFAPRHGVLSRQYHRLTLFMRIVQEDVLGLMYRLQELDLKEQDFSTTHMLQHAAGIKPFTGYIALAMLKLSGRINKSGSSYQLTSKGKSEATGLIRAHRLWETYLMHYLSQAHKHAHEGAEALEHVRNPKLMSDLRKETGNPTQDPQGKSIPPLTGGDEQD
ncbi:metal ABC transporter permease [Poriferisphaera sp. WC338]|uniref:metal ABC transporter permease n=1 Tax=Poriferisphaera sp. WC338 TaxID=3425129 RepID=UPI003D818105